MSGSPDQGLTPKRQATADPIQSQQSAIRRSQKRGTRRHLHENSFNLGGEPVPSGSPHAAAPAHFSPFQLNPPGPHPLDAAAATDDKEAYKAELRAQMEEKKAREARERERRRLEDLREEERLKREREELHRKFIEDDGGVTKKEGEGVAGNAEGGSFAGGGVERPFHV